MKAKLLRKLRKIHRIIKSGVRRKYVFMGRLEKLSKKYASQKYYSSGWSKSEDKINSICRANIVDHAREVFASSQNRSFIQTIRNLYFKS